MNIFSTKPLQKSNRKIAILFIMKMYYIEEKKRQLFVFKTKKYSEMAIQNEFVNKFIWLFPVIFFHFFSLFNKFENQIIFIVKSNLFIN